MATTFQDFKDWLSKPGNLQGVPEAVKKYAEYIGKIPVNGSAEDLLTWVEKNAKDSKDAVMKWYGEANNPLRNIIGQLTANGRQLKNIATGDSPDKPGDLWGMVKGFFGSIGGTIGSLGGAFGGFKLGYWLGESIGGPILGFLLGLGMALAGLFAGAAVGNGISQAISGDGQQKGDEGNKKEKQKDVEAPAANLTLSKEQMKQIEDKRNELLKDKKESGAILPLGNNTLAVIDTNIDHTKSTTLIGTDINGVWSFTHTLKLKDGKLEQVALNRPVTFDAKKAIKTPILNSNGSTNILQVQENLLQAQKELNKYLKQKDKEIEDVKPTKGLKPGEILAAAQKDGKEVPPDVKAAAEKFRNPNYHVSLDGANTNLGTGKQTGSQAQTM